MNRTALIITALLIFDLGCSLKTPERMKYLENFINVGLETDQVEIKQDEHGFLMVKNDNFQSTQEALFQVKKDYVLNGCIFFPFKDHIMKAIKDAIIQFDSDKMYMFQAISMTYQIMYYLKGSYHQARNYYKKIGRHFENEIYVYEPPKQIKEYLKILYHNIPPSSYTYNYTNIRLLKSLGLTSMRDFVDDVFNYVSKSVYLHEDSTAKVN